LRERDCDRAELIRLSILFFSLLSIIPLFLFYQPRPPSSSIEFIDTQSRLTHIEQADELSTKITSLEHQVTQLVQSYDQSQIQLDPQSQSAGTQNQSQAQIGKTNTKTKTDVDARDVESGQRRHVKDNGLARSLDAGSDDEDEDSAAEEADDDDDDDQDDDEDEEDERARDDDDAMSEASYDEKFKDLEEEVATLVADVHDLALYTKLNFTGFVKIVKVSRVVLFSVLGGPGEWLLMGDSTLFFFFFLSVRFR
jgi:hypothetical protein